ncbi:glutathione S-transferase [Hyphomicrobium sp.]|jgi:glutathione S-transferase|uniref:glutathione S-transferase family protein n=1 Tax=Hyphomicrobium sp. TaxID=82 RepID=UPI002B889108|nr:glutathione S-transferase [Hyphomicrobium sp.]HVZ04664.1 glutathione S-transferase [Hyphomicrobium sp.]
MKLYGREVSGNSYKVRLLCALLGVPVELANVDLPGGEHKGGAHLARNPFGQIPVLDDGGRIIRDSQAILIYIARKWGGETWCPSDAAPLAEVAQWLMVAENEIARGFADARLHDKFGIDLDVALAREKANRVLAIMDSHLAKNDWLALGRATIADVACMPYIALSHEGGISLEPYPAVKTWIGRIKALPNFIGMPGITET